MGVAGVTSAFTALNNFWGRPGPQAYLYITFNWSNGTTYTQPLVGNVNVRDYNNDGNTNSINNTTTIQVWDNGLGQRLDRQEYIFPTDLAGQVLTSVTLTDTGNQGEGNSRAVFSALTVSTCHSYVTEGITISSSTLVYHPGPKVYAQQVSLSNIGSTALNGPLFLILEDLPAGVSVVNESKPTSCYAPIGSPYVIALPEGSSLAPNTTVIVNLGLSDPLRDCDLIHAAGGHRCAVRSPDVIVFIRCRPVKRRIESEWRLVHGSVAPGHLRHDPQILLRLASRRRDERNRNEEGPPIACRIVIVDTQEQRASLLRDNRSARADKYQPSWQDAHFGRRWGAFRAVDRTESRSENPRPWNKYADQGIEVVYGSTRNPQGFLQWKLVASDVP